MRIHVKVKPNARESRLAQEPDGSWSAALKAPPVDGKANAELIALVARQFGCAKSAVTIQAGGASRSKWIRIDAADD